MKKLAIVGSALSGGAAQVIDAVKSSCEFEVVGLFDNNLSSIGKKIFDVPVVATSQEVIEYYKKGFFDEIIIAIGGDLLERERLYKFYTNHGLRLANVIDKTAQIRHGAIIGSGNVILANVFIGPNVLIGDNCYIISNTCINHDSIIGSNSYFSAGCTLAGNVKVGKCVRFDTASGSKANVSISSFSHVKPGVILIEDI